MRETGRMSAARGLRRRGSSGKRAGMAHDKLGQARLTKFGDQSDVLPIAMFTNAAFVECVTSQATPAPNNLDDVSGLVETLSPVAAPASMLILDIKWTFGGIIK
jgi:hypothetical protein